MHHLSDSKQVHSGFGLSIFYLYTMYIEQHIKTYNNIQFTNGIQKKSLQTYMILDFKVFLVIMSR